MAKTQIHPVLHKYPLKGKKPTAAILICPGGGYTHLAPHEGEPIARWVNSLGLAAFVLHYRLEKHPAPLEDAQWAIRSLRFQAEELNIDPNRIAIMGFSAGGHLAASAAIYHYVGNPIATDQLERISSRPDAAILCYPVISFGKFGHKGSMENLLGKDPSWRLKADLSLENAVSKRTPPTFIWHTADDEVVPVENSILLAESLASKNVPFALHIYPHGRHGLGLGEGETASWPGLCADWLQSIGFIEPKGEPV